MLFTIEFFRLREEDDAHATLDRITQSGTDLEAVKVKAKSLFKIFGTLADLDAGLGVFTSRGKSGLPLIRSLGSLNVRFQGT